MNTAQGQTETTEHNCVEVKVNFLLSTHWRNPMQLLVSLLLALELSHENSHEEKKGAVHL